MTNLEMAIHEIAKEKGLPIKDIRDVWAAYWQQCKKCLESLPMSVDLSLTEKDYESKMQGVKFENLGTLKMRWIDYQRFKEYTRKKHDKAKKNAANVHRRTDDIGGDR